MDLHEWLAQRGYYLQELSVLKMLEKAACSPTVNIAIEGESGTGKTALALLLIEYLAVDGVLRLDPLDSVDRVLERTRHALTTAKGQFVVFCDGLDELNESAQRAV